jgi:hypothetical protein
VLAAALPAYRKARGLDERPAVATAAVDFHGPVV